MGYGASARAGGTRRGPGPRGYSAEPLLQNLASVVTPVDQDGQGGRHGTGGAGYVHHLLQHALDALPRIHKGTGGAGVHGPIWSGRRLELVLGRLAVPHVADAIDQLLVHYL